MIKRLVCAIVGHRWHGAGWMGVTNFYCCWRCEAKTQVREPDWHRRAMRAQLPPGYVRLEDPDKFTGAEPDYSEQLAQVNADFPIEVLAKIHDTTPGELRVLGYQ